MTPSHLIVLGVLSAVAYLIGSIPFGYLIARLRGVDIRQHGSGNIGATNVLRVLGKKWGGLAFALDAGKGASAVLLGLSAAGFMSGPDPILPAVIAAVACIIGHNYTCWLGFKGGKGIATSAGALLALIPLLTLAALVVWLVVFRLSRYVSLASIAAAISLPLLALLALALRWPSGSWAVVFFTLPVAALAVWRHKTNIARLLDGTEHRFVPKTSRPPSQ